MAKYKEKILKETVENVIEGVETPAMAAEKSNVPVSAINNAKARTLEKRKLSVSFQGKGADSTLPKNNKVTENGEQKAGNTEFQGSTPIDMLPLHKGFWGFIDGTLLVLSKMSQGQIEYEKLDPSQIDTLAQVSQSDPVISKIVTYDGAQTLITLGYASSIFIPRIKIVGKKHDEKKAEKGECECRDCKKEIQKAQKRLGDLKSVPIKEEIKQVEKKSDEALKEFIERNSDAKDLAQADKHIEAMKNLPEGRLRITE